MTVVAPPAHQGRLRRSRGGRLVPPALVAGTLAVATIALHVRDPHDQGSWGACPTQAFLGVNCPGCGGLRAVNNLTNLRVGDAASSNLLLVAAIPFLVYFFARWTVGRWTGRRWNPSERSMNVSVAVFLVVLVAFSVIRNTTVGSWLAP